MASSRATTGSAAVVTTERRSRRSSSSTTAWRASARSSQSATRTRGSRSCGQRLDAGRLDRRLPFGRKGRRSGPAAPGARPGGRRGRAGRRWAVAPRGASASKRLPMGAARLEPLGLGSLRDLGHRRERRALAPLPRRAGGAGVTFAARAPGGRLAFRPGPVAGGGAARRRSDGRPTVADRPSACPGAPVDRRGRGRPGPACRPGWSSRPGSRDHRGSRCARAPCGGCAPARPSGSRCPSRAMVGLDLEDVADLGPVGQQPTTRPRPGAPGRRRRATSTSRQRARS